MRRTSFILLCALPVTQSYTILPPASSSEEPADFNSSSESINSTLPIRGAGYPIPYNVRGFGVVVCTCVYVCVCGSGAYDVFVFLLVIVCGGRGRRGSTHSLFLPPSPSSSRQRIHTSGPSSLQLGLGQTTPTSSRMRSWTPLANTLWPSSVGRWVKCITTLEISKQLKVAAPTERSGRGARVL